nr:ABC-three component system middle component 2 [Agrobacterium cavarae]
MTDRGIYYSGSDLTSAFVGLLKTSYAEGLRDRAKWVAERFDPYTDDRLQAYMANQVGKWGAEFDALAALKDIVL